MKVLLFLLALLAVAFASQHLDNTIVTIGETASSQSEHFLISIDHIEDLVGESGELLAERDIRVALRFDVTQSSYQINEVPVGLGYSELRLKAQVMEVEAQGQPRPFDTVVEVKIRVFVGLRQEELEDGTLVDGVYFQERVVGVQENEFWQAEVVEQAFVFRKDGTVVRQGIVKVDVLQGEPADMPAETDMPEMPGAPGDQVFNEEIIYKPGEGMSTLLVVKPLNRRPSGSSSSSAAADSPPSPDSPHHTQDWFDGERQTIEEELHHLMRRVHRFIHHTLKWFHSLPFYQRVLVAFAFGVVVSVVSLCFLKCLARCCCGKKKRACKNCSCSAPAPAPAPANNNYKENIRVYSLQYTAVPQDEKDAKKKEGTVEMV